MRDIIVFIHKIVGHSKITYLIIEGVIAIILQNLLTRTLHVLSFETKIFLAARSLWMNDLPAR